MTIATSTISVLIVDDQTSVRARLKYLVNLVPDFTVIGLAEDGLDAITYASNLQPDIILIDLEMPQLDGLKATKIIAQSCPKTKILVLSSYDKQEYIAKSMLAGATGYLLKSSSDEEIQQAIRFVQKGITHIGAGLFEKMLPVVKQSNMNELEPLNNNLAPISTNSLTIQSPTEITEFENTNSTRQILAWLILTLSLTTGIYAMRQWLRKPIPTLTYAGQTAKVAETKFTGKVEPAKTLKIAAIDPSSVEDIHVKLGEKVTAGQTLLTLKNLAAENEQKQIIQEQQLTRQQQQTLLQQQQTAQQRSLDLEQKINRLKYNLVPLRQKIAEANLQLSLAQSNAAKLPLRQRQDSTPRTKALYERAKARFERLDSLHQQGAISKEQLEQAQAELEVAQVDYNLAIAAAAAGERLQQSQIEVSQLQERLAIQEQQNAIAQLEKQRQTANLEYRQITDKLQLLRQQAAQLNKYQVPTVRKVVKATEAGIVAELPVGIGDQIYAGNSVIELAELEKLKIEVPVSGRLINALSPQQEAVIQIGTGVTAQKFEGKIATVNPLPTKNLNYLVEVEFANPTESLIIGQLAQVQFLPQTIAGGN